MSTNRFTFVSIFILTISLILTACGGSPALPADTSTPVATNTPQSTNTPQPTFTLTVTSTPLPTSTPTAIPCPTSVPDSIFSDGFEVDCGAWDVSTLAKIQDGVLQLTNGTHEMEAIVIPTGSSMKDSMVQVDILPSPTHNSSDLVFYGAGCRMDPTGTDFYFFGLTPVGDGSFMPMFIQFADSKIVDQVLIPNFVELPKSQNGEGVTVTFACLDHTIGILSDGKYIAKVTDPDLIEGDVFLGILQLDGIEESVSFDNVIVTDHP